LKGRKKRAQEFRLTESGGNFWVKKQQMGQETVNIKKKLLSRKTKQKLVREMKMI
jgi:hypothetical protein